MALAAAVRRWTESPAALRFVRVAGVLLVGVPVALVPWMLLLRTAGTARRAALWGWRGGTGLMLAVHHWLLPNLHVFTPVLAGLLGVLWAPWGWLVWWLLRGVPGRGRAAAALVPCGWLMVEVVRSWEYLGRPWGLLGASQWQVGPALELASVGGVWLVSLLVVAVNTAIVVLVAVPGAWHSALVAVAAGAGGGLVAVEHLAGGVVGAGFAPRSWSARRPISSPTRRTPKLPDTP